MIENFPNERRLHCETGAFVSMMEYYGLEMSEAMAFGIGSGLYFLYTPYIKIMGMTYPIFRSLPLSIIRNVSKRLRLDYHELKFGKDVDKATSALDALVEKQIPVGISVDAGGLNYFERLGQFNTTVQGGLHLNGHIICVVGKEGSKYYIADSDFRLPNDNYVTLEESTMREIRFAPGFATPHGLLFYFDGMTKDLLAPEKLKPAIVAGLKKTVHDILGIPFRYFGPKGIHYFANDLKTWEQKYPQKRVDYLVLWLYRFIERAGTGGAAYRFMYADFLKESAELFQSEVLNDSQAFIRQAADGWRQFSINCNNYIKREGITLNEMADILEEISNYEKTAFTKIKKEFLK